jgi:hypothetical protein
MDMLLAGNEYQTEVMTGRYDASYGCWLKGGRDGHFTVLPPVSTGFILHGDVKDMAFLPSATGGKLVVAAVNSDSLRVFRILTPPGPPPSSILHAASPPSIHDTADSHPTLALERKDWPHSLP